MHFVFKILSILFLLTLFACHEKQGVQQNSQKKVVAEENSVSVAFLHSGTFTRQVLANATLKANKLSELTFQQNGRICTIVVANGDRVTKNQALAWIDASERQQQLTQSELALNKAKLELQNTLIGLGHSLEDTLSLPKDKLELASLRSGYAQAELEYQKALFQLQNCTLRAPFSGVIANIKQNENEHTNGEAFCTLIDDAHFKVNFQLMETELQLVKVGDKVKVQPLAMEQEFTGTITSINPVVDEHGLVTLTAHIKNSGNLMEGMNAQITIEQEIPNQFVVPKSAVVLRQNQEVLFRVVNGKAFWTYVLCTHENATSYAVVPNPEKMGAELNEGDTIIVSGNLNLAHESDITFTP